MIENLKCCLAHPMTALRTLKNKVNEVITGHNELVEKVDNLPTGGGGGGSLPTGGEAYQMLVTNHKGEAEWQPRPFYEQVNEIDKLQYSATMLEQGAYMLTPMNSLSGRQYVLGETYEVQFLFIGAGEITPQGSTKCRQHMDGIYFGNMSFLNGESDVVYEDTGEYYLIGFMPTINVIMFQGDGEISIVEITGQTSQSIHLPAKYAPCVVSPSGTKYKIVVSDEGTLSAEQVEIEPLYP